MANLLKNTFIFCAGAAVGYFAANYLLKDKYEKIAEEEIKSTKESFSNITKIIETPKEKAKSNRDKPDIIAYASTLSKSGYTDHHINYADVETPDEDVEYIEDEETDQIIYEVPKADPSKRPYVIDPDNFGDFAVYSRECLMYYIDGVMANEENEVIEDVDFTIGLENLEHFGEYETGALFIRNDNLRTDYEIYIDKRAFSEVMSSGES